ncbi:MAG TPA: retropepsin-like aspartic protease [Casimicrobiaceae bacterium]|nr:retropepsin-like aspartic protease [Casimicrobiaceae bacterium]
MQNSEAFKLKNNVSGELSRRRSDTRQCVELRRSTMNHLHHLASIAFLLVSTGATALDVNVVGLFPNKAVVQIEGGALQTLSVGQKIRGDITLVSVQRDRATFDLQGQRVELELGQARRQTSRTVTDSVAVPADGLGRFIADGQVNGVPMRFAVDTGATFVTLSAREAGRLGIDYRSNPKLVMETANGDVFAYRTKLDTVRVGEVVLHNVDAVITEGTDPSVALLGMSFLGRTNIRHEGAIMTLTLRQ